MKNKGIVITGGSAGLGLALAKTFVENGNHVVITGRDPKKLEAAASGLLPADSNSGGSLHTIEADISQKASVYPTALEAQGVLGKVDLLINNASSLGKTPLPLLVDSDCEDLEQVLQTNVLGPFRLTKALLPGMLLRKSGLVVNMSSDAAVSAYPQWGHYGLSKAALDHLSRIWNEELRGKGVDFVAIDPGDMATALQFAAIPDRDPNELSDPEEVARALFRFLSARFQNRAENTRPQVRFSADAWRAQS